MANRVSNTTTDHDTIRHWAEERGGKPSQVATTARGGQTGIIRIDFPGFSGAGKLEEISWDEWFQKFDEANLALVYEENTAGGQRSNFNKLVGRETAQARAEGKKTNRRSLRSGAGRGRSAGGRSSARQGASARARGGSTRASRGGARAKTTATRSTRSASSGTGRRQASRAEAARTTRTSRSGRSTSGRAATSRGRSTSSRAGTSRTGASRRSGGSRSGSRTATRRGGGRSRSK